MRSPEHLHHQPAPPRAGKNFEVDLHLRYLSPGAFTILPANEQHLPPDPPSAPDPFRLTPTSRRHKNQSFAIIGEPTSRSTSPTPSGRVSPFRGHGFNPSGSRLASPSSSPPPEDLRYPPKPKTKIPKPSRHQNQHVFGEKVSATNLQTRRKLSQSLTSLESTKKSSSFKRLSPIIGSSPEPSQVSLSSPSRIPKSRSQPPSRLTSPTRVTSKPPIRPTVSSPAKKHYKNVQAKVNSFSSKAKVPNIERKNVNSTNAHAPKILVKRQQSVSKINLPPKNEDSNNNKPAPPPKMKKEIPPDKEPPKKPMKESRKISEISPSDAPPQDQETPKNQMAEAPKVSAPRDSEKTENPNPVKLTDLLQPTATTVVSSTTSTVTQPLKIEAKIEPMIFDKPKPVSPMVDGRVLSATSVSHAMNRMSDTQSVIKDGFTTGNSLSPEANAVISMAHESKVLKNGGNFENSLKKLTQPIDNAVQKSVNERIKEARAMVQPIRIIVKEKGADAEVQSGNVRISATNGLNNVRPGLPADNHHSPPNEPNNANNNTSEEPAKKNACCTKFFSKMQCCKKEENSPPSKGCFSCLKKKPEQVRINIEDEDEPKTGSCLGKLKCCGGKNNRISDSSCFPTGKRKDSWAQRRDSILSDPQPAPSRCSKDCCTNLMRKLFCINLCCKKKAVEAPDLSRKASVISKKKSLTLTTAPPLEDTTPKLDLSLVEHASAMKGAIPVLPICLAWFCLVMNCIAPGTGTVFSGMFCLCIGIPRFSQKDGAKGRIGSFIINLIIGVGQFFTVLFCLVGWGWSIWWGVIMIKIAKKYKKIKQLEKLEEDDARPPATQNHRDAEHGAS